MPSPIYGRIFNEGKNGKVTRQGTKNHPLIARLETWEENVTTILDAEGNFEFLFNPSSKYTPGQWVVRGNLGGGTFEVNPDVLEALGYVKEEVLDEEEIEDKEEIARRMMEYATSIEIREAVAPFLAEAIEDGTRFGLVDDLRFPLGVDGNDEATWAIRENLEGSLGDSFVEWGKDIQIDPEHSCAYFYSNDRYKLTKIKNAIIELTAQKAEEVRNGA